MGKNLVKIIGALSALLAFIQAYPGLQNMLSASHYTLVMFLVGVGLAVLGYLRKIDTSNIFNQWKTVLLGVATAAVSAAQGFGALKDLMSAATYGWVMFAFGALAVVFGIYNTMTATDPNTPPK